MSNFKFVDIPSLYSIAILTWSLKVKGLWFNFNFQLCYWLLAMADYDLAGPRQGLAYVHIKLSLVMGKNWLNWWKCVGCQ